MSNAGDIFDRLAFLDEHLAYVDAPLEGFVRADSGELFAFRCCELVRDVLWHWILIPVAEADGDVATVFQTAAHDPPERWLSIIEDRRRGDSTVIETWLRGAAHSIPVTWI